MIVGRGVEKVEGRCGGQAVLVGTRLTIRCLDAMWKAGGDAFVAKEYPYLTREQRLAAYGYAEEHRAEFDSEDASTVLDDGARAVALLRKHEWCGDDDHCPECGRYKNNAHASGCEWAELCGGRVDP